eukprot:424129-Ditylum_brightwellii.AAC.1
MRASPPPSKFDCGSGAVYGHIMMYFLFEFEWWMTCPSSPSNASASSGGDVSTSGAMLDEEQKKLKHE